MVRQNILRVLEDYELDHVSGGLDGEADFYAEPFNVPDGFTMENISGAFLQQDLTTGEWTVELVFESDFTEAGYASWSDTPDDGGGGIMPIMPAGQGVLDGDPGALSAGGQRGTTTTRVTTTKTSPSTTIVVNLGFITFTFTKGGTTTTSEVSTTTASRITSQGKTGRLPSK